MKMRIAEFVFSLHLLVTGVLATPESSPNDSSDLIARSYKYCGTQHVRCSSKYPCCKGYSCDSVSQTCKRAIWESCKVNTDCCAPNICKNRICVSPPPPHKTTPKPTKPTYKPPTSKQCRVALGGKCSAYASSLCCKGGTCSNSKCCLPRGQGTCKRDSDCCTYGDVCSRGFCQKKGTYTPPSHGGGSSGGHDGSSSCRLEIGATCKATTIAILKRTSYPSSGCCKSGTCGSSGKCCFVRDTPYTYGSGCKSDSECCTSGDKCNKSTGKCSAPLTSSNPSDKCTVSGLIGDDCNGVDLCCGKGICSPTTSTCCVVRTTGKGCNKDSDCCTSGDTCDAESGVCSAPVVTSDPPTSGGVGPTGPSTGSTCTLQLGDTCVIDAVVPGLASNSTVGTRRLRRQTTQVGCCSAGVCGDNGDCCIETASTGCTKDSDCCTSGDTCNSGTCSAKSSTGSTTSTGNTNTCSLSLGQTCKAVTSTSTSSTQPVPLSNSTFVTLRMLRRQTDTTTDLGCCTTGICGDAGTCCIDLSSSGCTQNSDCCTSGAMCVSGTCTMSKKRSVLTTDPPQKSLLSPIRGPCGVGSSAYCCDASFSNNDGVAIDAAAGRKLGDGKVGASCHVPSRDEIAVGICGLTNPIFSEENPSLFCCNGESFRSGDGLDWVGGCTPYVV